MNFLTSFISPKIGFDLIKGEIQRQLKNRPLDLEYFGATKDSLIINDFDTIYQSEKNKIDFKVRFNGKERLFPFEDGKAIAEIIKAELAKKTDSKNSIDIAIIKYRGGSISVDIFYTTPEGEKLTNSLEL